MITKKSGFDLAFKLAVLIIVFLLGMACLRLSFDGDQSLFCVYAKEMNEEGLLYRDVWDIKQPGIFVFYYVAGKLFGFDEVGIHFFELIYWLSFALFLQITLKNYFRRSLLSNLAPLLTVGVYYSTANSWHLTQVESLVGFPLYLTLWLGLCAVQTENNLSQKLLLFASGFSGCVVLMFKLIFLPLIVCCLLVNHFD